MDKFGAWKKIRSGRLVIGQVRQLTGSAWQWKSSNGDMGVTDSGKTGAVDRAIVAKIGSGTAAGIRRQYEIEVEE